MRSVRIVFGLFVFTILICNPAGSKLYAQKQTVKKEDGLKKDFKKILNILSFKGKLKHSDSAKMTKKYIREQQKLVRQGGNYPYDLNKGKLNSTSNSLALKDDFELGKEVLGWYPFWEKDLYKTLDYELLSTIAYFAYEVNPKNGNPKSIHDWNTTPLIDSARIHGKKVLLTVSNFGRANNRRLLKNRKSITNLINNLIQLITRRGAGGICVDFEGVHKSERNLFAAFIAQLKQQLKAANKSYELYMTVPSVDWEEYLDFETLNPYVDSFVIMGYDYYGQASSVAGPVAPLQSGKIWQQYNLEVSVDFYLSQGISSSKLLLALPYYGSIWETYSGKKTSKARKFIGSRTFDYIREKVTSPLQYDSVSKSMWSAYAVSGGKAPFRQVWFDNKETFSIKLSYLKQKKLKGLGIWALGYNKVNKELWQAIASNLEKQQIPQDTNNRNSEGNNANLPDSSEDNSSEVNSNLSADKDPDSKNKPDDTKKEEPASKSVSENAFMKKLAAAEDMLVEMFELRTLLSVAFLMVVAFGGVGFLIAMFHQDTRSFFLQTQHKPFIIVW